MAESQSHASRAEGTDAGRSRIASIDGLRATALLAVFAFHTWEFSGRPDIPVIADIVGANIRPDFFVVLTGFVLYLPFARDVRRIKNFDALRYIRRRLRRIVLPYWAALAFAIVLPQTLVVLMRALGREASWQPLPSLGDLLTHITFTHLFFTEYWDGVNGSLWTMSLEMQLYLLFPLLIVLMAALGRKVFGIGIAVSVIYLVAVRLFVDGPGFPDQFLWSATGLGRLVEFIAGMVAADVAFRVARRPRRGATVALLAGVSVAFWLATASPLTGSWFPAREVFLAVMFALLIFVAVSSPTVGRVFAARPMSALGYRAYSVFLVHQPVAWYLSEALKKFLRVPEGPLFLAIMWSLGLVVVLAVGQMLFLLVERPCIAWAKRVPTTRVPTREEPAVPLR